MRLFFLIIFMLFSTSNIANIVVFPGYGCDDYSAELLKHVLSYKQKNKYQVQFNNKNLPKNRVLTLISNNAGIDVISAGATKEREKLLLPIRFPILKGLNGWRIALVTKENKDIFLKNSTLRAFKLLTPGQLHSWSDTKVIASNDINVEGGSSYDGLFPMLENNRFDYFPRSILEVRWEYEQHKDRNIIIEPHQLIHYPAAYFFFVNKNNTNLAADISSGLEKALKDGSFERIFNKYFGSAIQEVQQENRRVFSLTNPFLPAQVPLSRSELWLDLHPSDNDL
jgi:hypothetical protein